MQVLTIAGALSLTSFSWPSGHNSNALPTRSDHANLSDGFLRSVPLYVCSFSHR
jgi:hypothetical protein